MLSTITCSLIIPCKCGGVLMKRKAQDSWLKAIKKSLPMTVFVIPGLVIMLINNYAPMFGLAMSHCWLLWSIAYI